MPVAPAAHYMMGGIATDLDGQTSVAGLFAVGECSCTGLHGANRLASNSLSECFVFGARAARAALAVTATPRGDGQDAAGAPAARAVGGDARALWELAGLERDGEGLTILAGDPHPLARLIATAALTREESRGAHQRTDFPSLDPGLDGRHVVIDARGDANARDWQ